MRKYSFCFRENTFLSFWGICYNPARKYEAVKDASLSYCR